MKSKHKQPPRTSACRRPVNLHSFLTRLLTQDRLITVNDQYHWERDEWNNVQTGAFQIPIRQKAARVSNSVPREIRPYYTESEVKGNDAVMVWESCSGQGGLYFMPKRETTKQDRTKSCRSSCQISFKFAAVKVFVDGYAP